ncbi:MAG: hypothetical protein HY537_06680 [Deltaproteobacteria bacterium]|nr:hypothetical protein [Deltaproteobacteria bacterium]
MQKRISACVLLFFISGCSSLTTVQLPRVFDDRDDKFLVKLAASGQIIVRQKFPEKAKPCEAYKINFKVEIKKAKGSRIPVRYVCTFLPGNLVAMSSGMLPKGEYEVRGVNISGPMPFKETPVLSVRYLDPDFGSGTDQDFGGAVELGENATVKGAVNYADGNTTNWIRAKGKGTMLLDFIDPSENHDLKALVFSFSKETGSLVPISALRHKGPRRMRTTGEVLIKVVGPAYEGERSYSVSRRDLQATKKVRIPVIDCYPLDGASSIVLLGGAEGLKANDEVSVLGKKATGENVSLGACKVISIEGSQASCRLDRLPPENILEYRAEAAVGA